MRFFVFAVLCVLAVLAAAPVQAQMTYYKVEKAAQEEGDAAREGDVAGDKVNTGSFVVTPVTDCFARLPPGEARAVRRDYSNPYQECLRRVEARKEGAQEQEEAAPAPSGKKEEEKRDMKKKFLEILRDSGADKPVYNP